MRTRAESRREILLPCGRATRHTDSLQELQDPLNEILRTWATENVVTICKIYKTQRELPCEATRQLPFPRARTRSAESHQDLGYHLQELQEPLETRRYLVPGLREDIESHRLRKESHWKLERHQELSAIFTRALYKSYVTHQGLGTLRKQWESSFVRDLQNPLGISESYWDLEVRESYQWRELLQELTWREPLETYNMRTEN